MKSDSSNLDQQNEKFWKQIKKSLKEAHQLLEKLAEEYDVDLDDLENETVKDNLKAEKQPVSIFAKNYIDSVNNWFNKAEPILKSEECRFNKKPESVFPKKNLKKRFKS